METRTQTVSREEQIKRGALSFGAQACGIAAAAAFEEETPAGFRPRDLLPNARSVIVVGGAQPRAGEWMSPSVDTMTTTSTADRINSVARKLAQEIENRYGYYALFVPPGTRKGNQPFLSLMLAAELAGVGTRSLAGPVLHPVYGFLYYAAVLTTLPLDADGRLSEPVCPAPSCVEMWEREGTTPCLSICPATSGGCLDGKIDNGRLVETYYNRDRCHTRVYTNWIPGFQKVLEEAMSEEDREKRKMLLFGNFFTSTLWSLTFSAQSQGQCFECMRVCPVGKVARK
jgi:epoxyqueuosine reductase QueG